VPTCWPPRTPETRNGFVRKHPEPAALPTAAWINKPAERDQNTEAYDSKIP